MRLWTAHARQLAAALRGCQPRRALHWTLSTLRRPGSPQQVPAGAQPQQLSPSRSVAAAAQRRAKSGAGGDRIDQLRSKHQPGRGLSWISEDTRAFWAALAAGVDKQSAKALLELLDLECAGGIRPALLAAKREGSMPHECLRYKQEHPRMVVLIRIGEFYEAFGLDAVMLVQHCGLNPMGTRAIPQAGCPVPNLRRTLDDLLRVGFSVVVVEEAASLALRGAMPKSRFKAGVVTPEQPAYMHGLIDREGDTTHTQRTGAPVLGVFKGVSGHKVVEVDVARRLYTVREALTQDSVTARIHEAGMAPPLYIFRPEAGSGGSGLLTDSSVEGEWELRIRSFSNSVVGAVRHYTGADFVDSLLDEIRRNLGLQPDASFTQVEPDRRQRPKALFHSTACQLGIHRTGGVPSLLDACVPPGTPLQLRAYVKELLLEPPPTEVAASVREAGRILHDLQVGLPAWTVLDAGNVVKLIESRETGDTFFRDLRAGLQAAAATMQRPELRPLAQALLPAAVLKARLRFKLDDLADACREAIQLIEGVIQPEAPAAEPLRGPPEDSLEGQLSAFFNHEKNSISSGKVRDALVQPQLSKLEEARERVEKELKAAFEPLEKASRIGNDPEKICCCVTHAQLSNSLWIRCYRQSAAYERYLELQGKCPEMGYHTPNDHKGHPAKNCVSTLELDKAVAEYRDACEAVREAVKEQLRRLAEELQPLNLSLVGAIAFNLVAASLSAHVEAARAQGWAQPAPAPAGAPMRAVGMTPYWMARSSPRTVRNELELSRVGVLTGPNMAGKSTVMRSACAVALLAACGLYAPVSEASVPYTDAFMLRTFSADSPREGKSSFAIEMEEMEHIKRDVSSDSLVLVDELGKGTEPKQGAAIACSFVNHLAGVGCRGLFATHLPIWKIPGNGLQGAVDFVCMGTQDACAADAAGADGSLVDAKLLAVARRLGSRVPTWRMERGICEESLAIAVMAKTAAPDDPQVLRAAELYESLLLQERQQAQAAAAADDVPQPAEPGHERLREAQPSFAELFDAAGGAAAPPPAPAAAESSGRTIDEAVPLLVDTAARVFDQIHGGAGASGPADGAPSVSGNGNGNGHAAPGNLPRPQAVTLHRGDRPPPATIGRSCVYVVRRPDGAFYVGETDDIKTRLSTHRGNSGRVKGGPDLEAAYLVVPPQLPGKSAAKAAEAELIRALQRAGFPLLSVADSRKRGSPRTD